MLAIMVHLAIPAPLSDSMLEGNLFNFVFSNLKARSASSEQRGNVP